jgi:hypothetical protein
MFQVSNGFYVFFYLFWGFASYKPRYLAGSAQVKIHLPSSAPLLQRRYFSPQLAGLVAEEEEALGHQEVGGWPGVP